MHEIAPPSPAVVVGVDGSRRAISAALWAVDEAVDRDLPLRLVYAIEPRTDGRDYPGTIARDFAAAESAVRHASMAVESVDMPVKLEADIVRGKPLDVLIAASRSAAMLCIGALGVDHATGKRLGSATTGMLSRATCPVAIIASDAPRPADDRWVVTEFDGSPDASTVLSHAMDQARLRNAPLRVLTEWHPVVTDLHGKRAAATGGRQAEARLERSLRRYRLLYPDLDIKAVAVQGSATNYLARHADSVQLIVLGHKPAGRLADLSGPGTCTALANLNCSVLVSERHGAL